jgi:preprotein translocase subunit SecA
VLFRSIVFRVQFRTPPQQNIEQIQKKEEKNLTFSHGSDEEAKKKPVKRDDDKPGRNDVCSCGSGKKFKKCCGK